MSMNSVRCPSCYNWMNLEGGYYTCHNCDITRSLSDIQELWEAEEAEEAEKYE